MNGFGTKRKVKSSGYAATRLARISGNNVTNSMITLRRERPLEYRESSTLKINHGHLPRTSALEVKLEMEVCAGLC